MGKTRQSTQKLVVALKQGSTLEDNIHMFGEVIYRHCMRAFGYSERHGVH